MAAWQVDFYIIPRRALLSRGRFESSDLDVTPWWATHPLSPDYQTAARRSRVGRAVVEGRSSDVGGR